MPIALRSATSQRYTVEPPPTPRPAPGRRQQGILTVSRHAHRHARTGASERSEPFVRARNGPCSPGSRLALLMCTIRPRGNQGLLAGVNGAPPHEEPLDDWLGDISDEDWSEDATRRGAPTRHECLRELPFPQTTSGAATPPSGPRRPTGRRRGPPRGHRTAAARRRARAGRGGRTRRRDRGGPPAWRKWRKSGADDACPRAHRHDARTDGDQSAPAPTAPRRRRRRPRHRRPAPPPSPSPRARSSSAVKKAIPRSSNSSSRPCRKPATTPVQPTGTRSAHGSGRRRIPGGEWSLRRRSASDPRPHPR